MVENLPAIIHEFKERRGLTPIRMVVHGPPASGKTSLSKRLAKEYEIHHLQLGEIIEEEIRSVSGYIDI